jgi:hypothetical protein
MAALLDSAYGTSLYERLAKRRGMIRTRHREVVISRDGITRAIEEER